MLVFRNTSMIDCSLYYLKSWIGQFNAVKDYDRVIQRSDWAVKVVLKHDDLTGKIFQSMDSSFKTRFLMVC